MTPVVETNPCEGRNPYIPQYDAGTLTLAPVSVPVVDSSRSLEPLVFLIRKMTVH